MKAILARRAAGACGPLSKAGLASFAALALASVAPLTATAQETEAEGQEVLEEIITTGYRSSLMNSISQKRNATSIVESISAEDIGKRR